MEIRARRRRELPLKTSGNEEEVEDYDMVLLTRKFKHLFIYFKSSGRRGESSAQKELFNCLMALSNKVKTLKSPLDNYGDDDMLTHDKLLYAFDDLHKHMISLCSRNKTLESKASSYLKNTKNQG